MHPALKAIVLGIACAFAVLPAQAQKPPVRIVEATIQQLQADMQAGRATSQSITRAHLDRIRRLDHAGPKLASVIQVNPDATSIAFGLDRERLTSATRGPLHGIPIVLKDNIDTGDRMLTTAGSLALDAPAPRDAFIARKLREGGAVIIGKNNLSEWANIRSLKSTSGWSAKGGQVKNPYGEGRNPCGSSSGTGTSVAASLAVAGIGTETDGSIMCPSSVAGLVGIKPTVGLVSRTGIIPISHSQDTAGPMTRWVADAAAVLTVIAGVDPDDPATAAAAPHVGKDYRDFLKPEGLRGMRIGVARRKVTGYSPHTDRLFEQAIADMKRLGAVIVDPADIGNLGDYDEEEIEVLAYELKDGLDRYLSRRGAKVKSLADVIAFNEKNKEREMPYFGQDFFIRAQGKGPLTEKAYLDALEKSRRLAREGIDKTLAEHKLDAIVAPTGSPAWLTDHVNGDSYLGASSTPAAVAGYPSITVTMGMASGLPVGLSFIGTAWSEGKLIQAAYGYEQGTKHRRAPPLPK